MKLATPRYAGFESLLQDNCIAVVGMSCRFCGIENYDEYWECLLNEREALRHFSREEIHASGEAPQTYASPEYVPTRGQIEDAERFDARFFGYSPQEAAILDPQQRIFLELAWHALEDAGIVPGRASLNVGVYAGAGFNTYLLEYVRTTAPQLLGGLDPWQVGIGNDKDTLTSRVAYKLNLFGPAVTVQTACSTSLAAIHLAARALLNFDCDIALAGGVSVRFPQSRGYLFRPEGIESPDGRCRPFGLHANGTVFGDGAGAVVLKRFEDAIEQGDRIYAVLRGSAINNDAALKAGYTAPSLQGQVSVLRAAQAAAGVRPQDIDYVEGHGTGTLVGDGIEVQALRETFGGVTRDRPCRIGSVKGNVGHTDNAAGIAGFIKTVLALYHGKLPRSLHCTHDESLLAADSALALCDSTYEWPRAAKPRLAGVSSFGVGGTNVHAILQEPPLEVDYALREEGRTHLIPLSAKSPEALRAQISQLERYLAQSNGVRLADVAHTYQATRQEMEFRDYRLASTSDGLLPAAPSQAAATRALANPSMAWLFPGQGSQFVGMGKSLYEQLGMFRDGVEECLSHVATEQRATCRHLLTHRPSDEADARQCETQLSDTRYTHLVLFIYQHALARCYQSLGLQPAMLLGHSLGELVAATVAGVFSLKDAVRLMHVRGDLISRTAAATLYSVDSDVPLTESDLPDGISISCWNGPRRYVLSGSATALENYIAAAGESIRAKRMSSSRGFHSSLMDGVIAPFLDAIGALALNPPSIPIVSSVTGQLLSAEQACEPRYWARQIRLPVQFSTAAGTLLAHSPKVLFEVGPGRQLTALLKLQGSASSWMSIPGHSAEESVSPHAWLRPIGSAWVCGAAVSWRKLADAPRRTVHVPGYPFQRDAYQIQAEPGINAPPSRTAYAYRMIWASDYRRPSCQVQLQDARCVLVGRGPLLRRLAAAMSSRGAHVFVLENEHSPHTNATEPAGYRRFDFDHADRWREQFAHLRALRFFPQHVFYLACDTGRLSRETTIDWPLRLVQSFSANLNERGSLGHRPTFHWLVNNVFVVHPGETALPDNGLLWGVARVLPQEHEGISSHLYDLGSLREDRVDVDRVLKQIEAPDDLESFKVRALRADSKWLPHFLRLDLPAAQRVSPMRDVIRAGATYLITGGAGGIGRAIAAFLVRDCQAKVIACGRSPRSELRDWDDSPEWSNNVRYVQVDVAERAALADLVASCAGEIRGVFHCAGIAGRGLMVNKEPADGRAGFDAKIVGTQNLCAVFADTALDFMVFFSSINGWFGGVGQADYSAANFFLDLTAQNLRHPWRSISIAWDTWQATGMAARSQAELADRFIAVAGAHQVTRHDEGRGSCSVQIRFTAGHWLAREHQIDGIPCLPATAYVALIAQELRMQRGDSKEPLAFCALHFIRPFVFSSPSERLTIRVAPASDRTHFTAFNLAAREPLTFTAEARSVVDPRIAATASVLDARFRLQTQQTVAMTTLSPRLQLGDRWNCVEQVERVGESLYRIKLKLPAAVVKDFELWPLHPALMDASLLALQLQGSSLCIPISISDVVVYDNLSTARYSCTALTDSAGARVIANVWITDENFRVLVFLAGVTFVSANENLRLSEPERTAANSGVPPKSAVDFEGLSQELALDYLQRILGGAELPHVIVSETPIEELGKRPIDTLLQRWDAALEGSSAPQLTRRPLIEDHSEARPTATATLRNIFAHVLGIDEVDPDTSFFDLGGDSLIGLRVVSEARKAGLHLTLAILYRAKTVRGLVAELEIADPPQGASAHTSASAFALLQPSDRAKLPPAIADAFPLSQLQQGILYYRARYPGVDIYSDFLCVRVVGPCEIQLLNRSLAACVQRHPVLRTSIETAGYSEPLNLVHADAELLFTFHEVSGESDVHAWVQNAKNSELMQGVRPPISFFALSGVGEFWIVMFIDDALIDGWSATSLVAELLSNYASALAGQGPQQARLLTTFGDFVRHESEVLRSDTEASFWRRELSGAQAFSVCAHQQAAHEDRFDTAPQISIREMAAIPKETLQALAERHAAAPKSILLAAYLLALSVWRRNREIIVGVETHTRMEDSDGDAVLGLYLNTLPMRKVFVPQRLDRYIDEICQREGALLEHRHYPLSAIQRAYLKPLFDACFNYTHFHSLWAEREASAIRVIEHYGEEKTHYALKMWINRNVLAGGGFDTYIAYDRSRLSSEEVEALFAIYLRVLQAFSETPELSTTDLMLADGQHRFSCLRTPALPTNTTLLGAFEDVCARMALRPALFHCDRTMLFGELNELSNKLAHTLSERGIGYGHLIAVLLPRSPEWVAAILAVLKVGATFVAIDCDQRAAQSKVLIEAAGAEWLISNERARSLHDIPVNVRTLLIDADAATIARQSPANLNIPIPPQLTAYIVFTSGSTGGPKGVCATHAGLLNRCIWQWRAFPFREGDVCLLKTPSAFVDFIWELFGALGCGIPLVVAEDSDLKDPNALVGLINTHRVTHLVVVPAVLPEIAAAIERAGSSSPCSLRQVTVSGELLREGVIAAASAALPGATWINLYGSAEVSADVTYFVVPASEFAQANSQRGVPVGTPISDTAIYIVGPNCELLEEGQPGEVCVAGAGLSSGYLRRPGITAERFVPNPWAQSPSQYRMYRTGDLGRIVCGQLEVMGRSDRQVKIRGVRVNLDEIELKVGDIEGVIEAAARMHQGQIELCVQCADQHTASLWEKLRETLIAAERPARVYLVDALPRTPGGKIDRRRMPQNAVQLTSSASLTPTTEDERRLARLWQGLFPGAAILADSHFEELGGHSLLLVRLAYLIEQEFGVRPPIHDLLQAPLLHQQAMLVQNNGHAKSGADPGVVVDSASANSPFALTQVQQAYWIARQIAPGRPESNSHFYGEFEIENLDVPRLRAAWNRIVDRHPMLRAVVLPDGSQQTRPTAQYVIEEYDLTSVSESQRREIIEANRRALSHETFVPDRWPLFSLRVIRVTQSSSILCVSIDFLLVDAWSLQILQRELATLYRNPDHQLEKLEVTFRDLQHFLAARRASPSFASARDYWLRRASTLPASPDLPVTSGAGSAARVQRRCVYLNVSERNALASFARHAGISLTGVLLAAYAAVLQRWSENKEFSVVLTLMDRPPIHPQIDSVVGDFTSVLLLEVRSHVRSGFAEFARSIEQQLHRDLDHREFSAIELSRALQNQGRNAPAASYVFTRILELGSADHVQPIGREIYRVTQTPDVWIDQQAVDVGDGLRLHWDTRDDAFPDGMVADMFAAYRRLIEELLRVAESAAASEDARFDSRAVLSALEPLRQADAVQIPARTLDRNYMRRIWEAVQAEPRSPAVLSVERELTYAELWIAATRLHERLCAIDPVPKTVGIHMPAGYAQIIAVLATQIGGFCYVPLSWSWPELRIREIVSDGAIDCILSVPGPATYFGRDRIVIHVTDEVAAVADATLEPPRTVEEAHLAYVMFTSGSTGKPKGVMMRRAAVGNTLADMVARLELQKSDRVFALSELSFDLSVFDILGSLMAGAAIVMPDPMDARDPRAWWHLCHEYRVTIWNSVPAYMDLFLDYVRSKSSLPELPLRWILLSGDWIPLQLPPLIWRSLPHAKLLSLGGATEAGIWSVIYPVTHVDPSWRSIPYGSPLEGQGCRILDAAGDSCPDGIAGELCITGGSLSDGYWRQPELTSEVFCVDPRDGQRMYRTGDLARYNRDGVIELLGRRDTQVKIAGNRIECGEIEQMILRHPAVTKACVVAIREHDHAAPRLHAIIATTAPTSLQSVQEHCREHLPISMLPAQWHAEIEIPLTSNGKVDRKRLVQMIKVRPLPSTGGTQKGSSSDLI